MKIMLVCRVYAAHRRGGMPHVVQDRAHALLAAGHDVLVVTTGYGKSKSEAKPPSDGVPVIYTGSPPEVYSADFASSCAFQFVHYKPDILHLDSFDGSNRWWEQVAIGKARTACTLHGFGWGAFLTKWNLYRCGLGGKPDFDPEGLAREAKHLGFFNTVIGVSLHEVDMLRLAYGLDAKLVYNPIAKYFFDPPFKHPPLTPRFLCVAHSGKTVRGFDIAQKAAAAIGVEMGVINDLPRRSLPAVYDGCTALVLPTFYAQGYDLTVAEALARRRPVIVSEIGSYTREAAAGQEGLHTFPLNDVKALTEIMRRKLPAAGEHAAAKHYPQTHARKWLEAIEG